MIRTQLARRVQSATFSFRAPGGWCSPSLRESKLICSHTLDPSFLLFRKRASAVAGKPLAAIFLPNTESIRFMTSSVTRPIPQSEAR